MPTAARAARNESLFREVNEAIRDLHLTLTDNDPGPVEFVCECTREDCVARITLPIDAYRDVRASPRHFVVKRGHVNLEVERIVHSADDYVIVDKRGEAGDIAEEAAN